MPYVKIGTSMRMRSPFTTWICAGRSTRPKPRFLSMSDDSACSVQVWPFDWSQSAQKNAMKT